MHNEKKTNFKDNLHTGILVGLFVGAITGFVFDGVIGGFIGLIGGIIVGGLFGGFLGKDYDAPLTTRKSFANVFIGMYLGSVAGAIVFSIIGVIVYRFVDLFVFDELHDFLSIGKVVGMIIGGIVNKTSNKKRKEFVKKYLRQHNDVYVQPYVHNPLKLGVENPIIITIDNQTETSISNIQIKTNFPEFITCNETISDIDFIHQGSLQSKTIYIIPKVADKIDLGDLKVSFNINDNSYEMEPVKIGIYDVIPPEIDIQIDVSEPLRFSTENPLKITLRNQSDESIFNVRCETNFSRLIKCDETTVYLEHIPAKSSKYTFVFITPRVADEIDLGDLKVSFEVNDCVYEKSPVAIGTYESVDFTTNKLQISADGVASDLSMSRETEFYQGYIRFKMSVTNTSSFVVNDVALDFDFDDDLLRIDRHEPDYQIKNGKIILGNISSNSSKTVAVYFDPMMCSKGTDINCQINYKNAKGQLQTNWMEPKKISVVCPVIETDSDINIGRLKEFIEKLPHSDSKVYQIQTGFAIDVLKNISKEVIQKHDVKHIRTLSTKDRNTCEMWYYGKTKVHSHDIVIKVTISSETQSVELFAATQSTESLVGLLAEFGRELKSSIENNVAGNVQKVINLSIIDSIVQRSNLLSYCDIDGNCSGDIFIENSLVQRSNISNNIESNPENKEGVKEMNT